MGGVNKDSVVYDNCAGTGGFLISALSKMVKDAKDDLNEIKKIKEKQVIGVEYQAHIFALACSNMYIHEDGKTNIIKGDCFDIEVMEQVKEYKPTIGFLNPPYQVDKKKDTEELKFVGDAKEAEILDAVRYWQKHTKSLNKFDGIIFIVMLKRDKEIAKTHNYLGLVYYHQNDDDQAIYHFNKALEIWPNFNEAKQNLREVDNNPSS